jgi:CheY-like chemotaxis protein
VISRPPTAELLGEVVDVMIVDDDVPLRESLLEWLQLEGFVTIAACNGAEALWLARDRCPRVVLLDLEMPILNGWQFLERRRCDRELARIPVVILSALPAGSAGRYDIAGQLPKPIEEERLLAMLRPFLAVACAAGRQAGPTG